MKRFLKIASAIAISTALFGCELSAINTMDFQWVQSLDSSSGLSCAVTFNEPGIYTLDRDLESASCGIEIKSSGVEIDLNGHRIQGPSDKNTMTYGIFAKERSNVKIRNGYIDGFSYGVLIRTETMSNITISGNQVINMKISDADFRGIAVSGINSLVQANQIINTGGLLLYPDAYGFGIEMIGPNCTVSQNEVTETYGSDIPALKIGEGVAISFSHRNNGCVADSNIIHNSRTVTNKSTFGFWVDVYSAVTIENNTVSGMHYSGIVPPVTVLLNNTVDKPMDNVIYDRN